MQKTTVIRIPASSTDDPPHSDDASRPCMNYERLLNSPTRPAKRRARTRAAHRHEQAILALTAKIASTADTAMRRWLLGRPGRPEHVVSLAEHEGRRDLPSGPITELPSRSRRALRRADGRPARRACLVTTGQVRGDPPERQAVAEVSAKLFRATQVRQSAVNSPSGRARTRRFSRPGRSWRGASRRAGRRLQDLGACLEKLTPTHRCDAARLPRSRPGAKVQYLSLTHPQRGGGAGWLWGVEPRWEEQSDVGLGITISARQGGG